jgi:hypothetical protein
MTPIELLCFRRADSGSASFRRLCRALAAPGAEAAQELIR